MAEYIHIFTGSRVEAHRLPEDGQFTDPAAVEAYILFCCGDAYLDHDGDHIAAGDWLVLDWDGRSFTISDKRFRANFRLA